ncbi:D-alanyl-D-alanine-carboxypeptidase/endopeptidase AmpH [Roseibium marinum]|uniref:D-alanyl-D-alanine-carboxypeptidase/D-alanyl-D-alanine-endopeptidase n=1 Tax=Roseibium marinum TaxID=281252 RepID=A0A2S3URY4_9HYPH|nr:D-alanyl-D-alanine-carboxypeptidase/endopeptidase AmpH [Roseibium marinum]POF30485.1 D-alanyl-D-alanine-carboxypeptidase/D-alanyl-D-alanine-endopeptidase [Roseibium marinum]
MKFKALILAFATAATPAFAEDALLSETLEFTAEIFYLDTAVPGVVIAAVRNGETAVFGVGETSKDSGVAPDGDTAIGVGSITKSFTGLTLANLAAEGTVALTDPAGPLVDLVERLPERDGHQIRLVDLATHSSGLPRELEQVPDVEKYSDASFKANLKDGGLLFAPGTGLLYSNIGFDVLAMALSGAADKPYEALLKEKVLDPIGLTATGYAKPTSGTVLTGYDWNGNEMDPGEPIPNRSGASQLYTTANDMLRYLEWNLDRFGGEGMEARAISHAAWVMRDGMDPVYGLDESGHMNAMGLGWVIMMPEGDRPLIIQKAGGSHGVFSYLAFAPSRGVGIFMSINQFNFSASMEMANVVNDLIAVLAPR